MLILRSVAIDAVFIGKPADLGGGAGYITARNGKRLLAFPGG